MRIRRRWQPSDGAPPPRHGGPGQPASLQAAGVALDVSSPGAEQALLVLVAPGDELAKIKVTMSEISLSGWDWARLGIPRF